VEEAMTVLPFPTKKLPKDTHIVVTGSMGFIGKHLTRRLVDLGYNIVETFDIRKRAAEDICVAKFPPADWCFHLAALTDAQCADEAAMEAVNYQGTIRVLEAYREKTIFASTCAINYPGTPYADSKLKAERMVRVYRGRSVRLCNIFGPGGHGVIDHFARAPVLRVRGSGAQLRTYAHVNHAVAAFIRQMSQVVGNIHILPGMTMTVNEIAEAFYPDKPIERVARSPLDPEYAPQVYA
jgi:nucleoside-diphosphate-sugar epimerase